MNYSLNALYAQIGISKQGVSQYIKRQEKREFELYELIERVDKYRAEHGGCGLEKLYHSLRPSCMGRDRFIAFFQRLGYGVKRSKSFIRTTIPGCYKFPNLIEGSLVHRLNQVWQSDITYILVGANYYYLVFILDVYSRRILGWTASDHLRASANVKALKMALTAREGQLVKGLVHHSDRGTQYIAGNYVGLLRKKAVSISMGTKGMQNAYAERINGTIKNEYLKYRTIENLQQLKRAVKKAVDHYNNKRIHNHLPRRFSPVQFEAWLKQKEEKRFAYQIYCEDKPELKKTKKWLEFSSAEDLGLHSCLLYYSKDLVT